MAKTTITAKLGLDTTAFQRGMSKSKKSVANFAKGATASFIRMGAAFASIGLVKSIIGLGTAAAETASKFDSVFGPSADAMNEKILELKKIIPATTKEMQDALATFSAMATAFGLNKEAADEFSINMVKIAGDLASFHDMKPEEAFLKIRSAISGEFEPMKQLGIVMNEATLKQEALTLGIWDGIGALSAGQKAVTVQSLLIKQMGVAQGDAAATANSAANQIKFLQAKLKDTGAEIGNTMLPAVVSLVGAFASLINGAKAASEAVGTFLAGGPVKEDRLGGFRELAKQALSKEGSLGLKGRGGQQKMNKLIEERATAYADAADAQRKARKEEREASGQSEKNENGITDAITDPARKKAADDYLESLQKQILAAGKLEGLTKANTQAPADSSRIASKGPRSTSAQFDAADANKSGIVTGREQRAKESADRKASTEERRARTLEVAREAGAGERARDTSRNQRFDAREASAGLNLAGNDPTAGRKPLEEEAKKQTETLESISKTLTKLDSALGE